MFYGKLSHLAYVFDRFAFRHEDFPFYFIFFGHLSFKFLVEYFLDRVFDFEAVKYKRFSKAANEERSREAT